MKVVAYSDVGKVRKINEDSIFYTTNKIGVLDNLFILCDGMGGENAGDYASCMAIEYLKNFIEENIGEIAHLFSLAIEKTNIKLLEESKQDIGKKGMGTTLVLATIKDNILYFANIGDSRLYIIDENILQVSKDHTLSEDLVSKNLIEKYSKEYEENKHTLTRALGAMENIKADFFEINIEKNMNILICSDGLSNMLDSEDIKNIVENSNKEEVAKKLIDSANLRGGRDNISTIFIYGLDTKAGDIDAA